MVGICKNARQPLLSCIPGIDKDEATAVEHYVIGYMAFWHIAFVDEDCLVPCNDDALRTPKCYKTTEHLFRLSPRHQLFCLCRRLFITISTLSRKLFVPLHPQIIWSYVIPYANISF